MNQADFDRTFQLPFNEAAAWFRDKLNIPTARWDELEAAAHARAFTSAGAYQADLLAELRRMTDKAIAGGMDIREFRQQFRPLVQKYGWQLQGGGAAWRSDLIWRTNIQTAYQAGRWQQFEAAGIEYLKYVHNDSVMRPRPNHVAMNGTILPRTDPFWSVNYPPNGFGCKCRAVAATKGEYSAADPGRKVRPDNWQELPDKGWDANVGDSEGAGYRTLTAKFESLPNDIAREWMRRWVNEPAFERFVEEKIEGNFPVAVLKAEDMMALDTSAQTVWFSHDSLLKNKGKLPARSAGHPELSLADYRLIPEIIDQGEVYQKKDEKLVYLLRGERVYRAVLKKTKDGSENYFLSLFSGSDDIKAMRQVASKYKKIR